MSHNRSCAGLASGERHCLYGHHQTAARWWSLALWSSCRSSLARRYSHLVTQPLPLPNFVALTPLYSTADCRLPCSLTRRIITLFGLASIAPRGAHELSKPLHTAFFASYDLQATSDRTQVSMLYCRLCPTEICAWLPRKVTDLHRHFIDGLTIPSASGGEPLRRVDEVFDCWFESGSMPYAQLHYPFENQDFFQQSFPADFVAEGVMPAAMPMMRLLENQDIPTAQASACLLANRA